MALSREARLIERARRGEDAAFEQLHARHQPAILAFCRHLTGNREDAEDAVQHTFLAAYRRLAESTVETAEWRPWLFTVARNRCLTLLRARREHSLVEPDLATSFDGLALEIERRQELRDLVGDMARLPEPQRAALVLSQLEALNYREIGAVLDVTPEKVKALVFQARSSLAATREAREAPCFEIRHELATAGGAALRRRMLRRHVRQCEGCRDFEVAMRRQRHDLGLLLPVPPSVGLGRAVLDAIGRDTSAAGGAGTAAVGGGAGAGLGGTLAAIGLPGVAKLAAVVALIGGGASGALAADLPERVSGAVPWHGVGNGVTVDEQGGDLDVGLDETTPDNDVPESLSGAPRRGDRASGGESVVQRDDNRALTAADEGSGPQADDEDQGAQQPDSDEGAALPPGLANRDELPPGLAKRDGELPPGLAKRGDTPGSKPGNGSGAAGNGNENGGQGNGNSAGQGQGNGNGAGAQGGGGGQRNAGGNGNAGGNAGGSGGQGNGSGGGAQGRGGGQGNAGGNGNGNGGGKPH